MRITTGWFQTIRTFGSEAESLARSLLRMPDGRRCRRKRLPWPPDRGGRKEYKTGLASRAVLPRLAGRKTELCYEHYEKTDKECVGRRTAPGCGRGRQHKR